MILAGLQQLEYELGQLGEAYSHVFVIWLSFTTTSFLLTRIQCTFALGVWCKTVRAIYIQARPVLSNWKLLLIKILAMGSQTAVSPPKFLLNAYCRYLQCLLRTCQTVRLLLLCNANKNLWHHKATEACFQRIPPWGWTRLQTEPSLFPLAQRGLFTVSMQSYCKHSCTHRAG